MMEVESQSLYAAMVSKASNYSGVKKNPANAPKFLDMQEPFERHHGPFLKKEKNKGRKKKEGEGAESQQNTQKKGKALRWAEENQNDMEGGKKNVSFRFQNGENTSFSSHFLHQESAGPTLKGDEDQSGSHQCHTLIPSQGVPMGGENMPLAGSSALMGSQRSLSSHSFCTSVSLSSTSHEDPIRVVNPNQMDPASRGKIKAGPPGAFRYAFPLFESNEGARPLNITTPSMTDDCCPDRKGPHVRTREDQPPYVLYQDPENDINEDEEPRLYEDIENEAAEISFQGPSTVTSVNKDGAILYRHNPYSRSVSLTFSSASPLEAGERRKSSVYERVLSSHSSGLHQGPSDPTDAAVIPSFPPSSAYPPGALGVEANRTTCHANSTRRCTGSGLSGTLTPTLEYSRPSTGKSGAGEEHTLLSPGSSSYPLHCLIGSDRAQRQSSAHGLGYESTFLDMEEREHGSHTRGKKEEMSSRDPMVGNDDNGRHVRSTPSSLSSFSHSQSLFPVGTAHSSVGQPSSPFMGFSFSTPSSFVPPSSAAKDGASSYSNPAVLSAASSTRSQSIAASNEHDMIPQCPMGSIPSSLGECLTNILPCFEEYVSTPQGCHFLIRVLQQGDPEMTNTVLQHLRPLANSMFVDPNGCHVARALVRKISTSQLATILRILYPSTIYRICTTSLHTRRVVQTIFECHKGPELMPLVEVLAQDVCRLSVTQQGCIVIKQVLIHASLDQKALLLPFLRPRLATLATDQYGNYVVQELIVNHKGLLSMEELNRAFGRSRLSLCCNKCSSNVMEKLVTAATGVVRRQLVQELVFDAPHCYTLILNCFGNFVLQAIIQSSTEPAEFQIIYDTVVSFLPDSPYGQKISAKLNEKYRDLFQQEPPSHPSFAPINSHRYPLSAASPQSSPHQIPKEVS